VIRIYEVLVAECNHQYPGAISLEEIRDQRAALEKEHPAPEDEKEEAREAREAAIDAALLKEVYRRLHALPRKRSALCLSGGGIRSATFGLGIVQGLARHLMLDRFDFLSTVSGGGYLGSWLSAWIRREGLPQVEEALRRRPESPLSPEPEPVRHLRSYSRYMSPKAGILSADTWTLVGIFLRNLLLNWTVLLPLLAAALMFPRLSAAILVGLAPTAHRATAPWALGAAVAMGSLVIAYILANLPSLTDVEPPRSHFPPKLRSQGWFLLLCLLPLWLLAVTTSIYWAWTDLGFHLLGHPLPILTAFVLFGATLGLGGFLVSRLWVHEAAPLVGLTITGSGALGGLFTWITAWHLFPAPDLCTLPETEKYICAGAPLLLLMFLLAAVLFVGISSNFTSDADREWLARCGSWILILIVVRSVVSVVVIFGPVALLAGLRAAPVLVSAAGGASGVATLLLGWGAKTAAARKPGQHASAGSIVANVGLIVAAPCFALVILVGLSLATSLVTKLLAAGLATEGFWKDGKNPLDSGTPLTYDPRGLLAVVHYTPWWLVLGIAAGALLLGGGMGRCVNINRFSLHAAFRDRLIRAYLGASRRRTERKANPFTGFDELDNLAMAELKGNRPLPVLNLTLNLVNGKDLAWQDRKAEGFTVSPLHAGSWCLGYRDAARYGFSASQNQGITLGTAAAISGAAASPNMGYHSSPFVTFLLALWNVRLGWWLGNPGPPGQNSFATPGPRFAPGPLFAEAFGRTDDCSPYVYLSDGGHFENLGLYEMVLRRCRHIVVCDAGEDPDLSFEDLGNAIRKIRIDLGVPISFGKIPMRKRAVEVSDDTAGKEAPLPYFAVGRIGYSCVDYRGEAAGPAPDARDAADADATDGLLIYVKASLNGSEPIDVRQYAKAHPSFPHESTADQLYSESQFESYRELGSRAIESLFVSPSEGLEEVFARLWPTAPAG